MKFIPDFFPKHRQTQLSKNLDTKKLKYLSFLLNVFESEIEPAKRYLLISLLGRL